VAAGPAGGAVLSSRNSDRMTRSEPRRWLRSRSPSSVNARWRYGCGSSSPG